MEGYPDHVNASHVNSQNGNSNGVVSPPNPGPAAAAGGDGDLSYFDSLPDGYRFMPTDEEIILSYLQKKIDNLPLPPHRIKKVEFYEKPPEIFAEEHPLHREKDRYFFTSRDRKYSKGERPGRTVKDFGFWKATGRQKTLQYNGEIIGYKKMLVFYRGDSKDNEKTNWVMLEYVAHSNEKRKPKDKDDMKLDDWVIVKLYENNKKQEDEKCTSDHEENTPPKPANTSTPKKRFRKKKTTKKQSENGAQEATTSSCHDKLDHTVFKQEELPDSPPFDGETFPAANHAHSDNPILPSYPSASFTPNGQASFNTTVPPNNAYITRDGFSSNNLYASQSFARFYNSQIDHNASYVADIHSEPFLGPVNGVPMASLEQFQAFNSHPMCPQVDSHDYTDFLGPYGDGTYEAETQMCGFDSSSNGMLNHDVNDQNMFDQSFGCETVMMEQIPNQNGYTDQRLHFNSAPNQPYTERHLRVLVPPGTGLP